MTDKSHVAASCHTNPALLELQARIQAHTCQRRSTTRTRIRHAGSRYLHATHTWVRTRPIRYAFHSMILGIMISILSIGQIPLAEPTPPQRNQSMRPNGAWSTDQPRPLTGAGTMSVGVRPRPAPSGEVHLPTGDALFAMSTRSDWSNRIALPSFTTSIAVDSANLWTGPGILYCSTKLPRCRRTKP